MPKYKNSFVSEPHDFTIADEGGKKLGTLRLTPVSVKWKPANKQKFLSAKLEELADWLAENGTETKS